MSERRYVTALLGIVLGAVSLVLGVNTVVDPYRLRLPGALAESVLLRPDVYEFVRLNKAYAYARSGPDLILLGSSRVQWGMERDALPLRTRRPFNLALSGPRFDEIHATFRCTVERKRPQIVLVGLDFLAFDVRRPRPADTFQCDSSVLRAVRVYATEDALGSTMSVLRKTLADGDRASFAAREVLDIDGFSRAAPLFEPQLRSAGHRGLFRGAEESYSKSYADPYIPEDSKDNSFLTDLRMMVRLARTGGIELKFFINPEHARQLEMVRMVGLWERYEDWKRQLVRVIEEENRGSAKPAELWDFSGYDPISTEPLPAEGDRATRMRNFNDLAHYTPRVGAWMLAILLGESGLPVPADFGVRLTSANFEERLAYVRRAQAAYRASNSQEIVELETLLKTRLERAASAAKR